MDRAHLMAQLAAVLASIAPEIDAGSLQPGQPLRDQVDLDSMDWLNFLIALKERFQLDIAESDYGALRTLDALADYILARVAAP